MITLQKNGNSGASGYSVTVAETDQESHLHTEQKETSPPTRIFGNEPTSFEKIFGKQGGRLHPYASIKEEWTDNLYNLHVDEITSLQTTFSPGIWYSFPAMEKIPVSLNPHNAAIGGIRSSPIHQESFDRFMAYILGGVDLKYYSYNSDLNYTVGRIEGLFQYNMPFGISFRLQDRYSRDRNTLDLSSFQPEDFATEGNTIYVTSTPSVIKDYYSNLAKLAVMINVSEKYSLLLDYINFYLDYDGDANKWLDRTDNRYSLKLNYTLSPKTSFFLEYNTTDSIYETETDNDNNNSFYSAGIFWKGSAKTSLKAKGGLQETTYETIDSDSKQNFAMEMDFNYLITDKTHLSLNLYKALEQSDSILSKGKDTVIAKLNYKQNFRPRVKGNVEFWYETSDYIGVGRNEFDSTALNRQDKRFVVRPTIQYIIRDWLMTEMAYSFENRNSNDNNYDFTSQALIFSLNANF